jgi:DNA polymerase-3 subunit epsilon
MAGGLMDFVVVDVETANGDPASICQVGVVGFREGRVADSWESLVDPEDVFAPFNISIHGISPPMVAGAPTFPGVHETLAAWFDGRVVVSHTPFDKTALRAVCGKYGLPEVRCRWLDSARVVRRAWTECSRRGYGLSSVAAKLGIHFRHHDALEDARAAGLVLVRAIEETGLGVADWLELMDQPTRRKPPRVSSRP